MSDWYNIPSDFDSKVYISLHSDLSNLSEEEGMIHYENYGFYENRRYTPIPKDFDYTVYIELYPDLYNADEETAKFHYEKFGYFENRKYKKELSEPELLQVQLENSSLVNHFLQIYNTSMYQFKTESKIKFRYFCFQHINYIKNITLPNFKQFGNLEAVLVEFRCFPHLEFVIRNNILKLGDKWCHTVICGNLNRYYVTDICSRISPKIKIIRVNYDNLSPSEYSKFLSSMTFWDLLKGKKILIYQEDSIIFKTNIEDFLYFDYVGAPWYNNKNDNKTGVGNGGMSLRSRDIMIKVIQKNSVQNTIFNSDTISYMTVTNSSYPPEDVYFTKNMEDFNIGILADRHNASKFSTESILNENSFAGHNFWIDDPNWEKRLCKHNIVKFHPNYDLSFLEHRGGWKYILNEMKNNEFFSETSKIEFYDVIEQHFLWRNDVICKNKWCGIIHCTNITPPYLSEINIENLFHNQNFIDSLNTCEFIICLSSNVSNFLIKKIRCEMNKNIKIYTLKHPVIFDDIPLFTEELFFANNNKMLIQIGQQLRKMTSIYMLNTVHCSKMWLTGTKNFEKINTLLEKEIQYLGIDKNQMDNSVKMKYTETFEEFDELLTKNLVFIDLFDASANNSVLECIVRNTPIIINKLEGVVDYLGDTYPLYYDDLSEVPKLIDTQKILSAHEYLKKMDKTPFKIKTFLNNLYDIVYQHFLNC